MNAFLKYEGPFNMEGPFFVAFDLFSKIIFTVL